MFACELIANFDDCQVSFDEPELTQRQRRGVCTRWESDQAQSSRAKRLGQLERRLGQGRNAVDEAGPLVTDWSPGDA